MNALPLVCGLYLAILAILVLMTEGLKIDYGQKLGKTIIFAKNHNHAEKIYEVFNQEYPHLPGFAMGRAAKLNFTICPKSSASCPS